MLDLNMAWTSHEIGALRSRRAKATLTQVSELRYLVRCRSIIRGRIGSIKKLT